MYFDDKKKMAECKALWPGGVWISKPITYTKQK